MILNSKAFLPKAELRTSADSAEPGAYRVIGEYPVDGEDEAILLCFKIFNNDWGLFTQFLIPKGGRYIKARTCWYKTWENWKKYNVDAINEANGNLPGIEFLTRTITVESGKQAYDLQINATEYMIISICSEDRMGWQYTVTRGVSGTEATQNWAVCFIGNPTGTFTFKVAVLKIK